MPEPALQTTVSATSTFYFPEGSVLDRGAVTLPSGERLKFWVAVERQDLTGEGDDYEDLTSLQLEKLGVQYEIGDTVVEEIEPAPSEVPRLLAKVTAPTPSDLPEPHEYVDLVRYEEGSFGARVHPGHWFYLRHMIEGSRIPLDTQQHESLVEAARRLKEFASSSLQCPKELLCIAFHTKEVVL